MFDEEKTAEDASDPSDSSSLAQDEENTETENSDDSPEEVILEPDGTGDGADETVWTEQLKKLKTKLKTCETERQEYLTGWQRSRADYVNLKSSEEKAKHEIVKQAEAKLLLDFLKVADSFELAVANKEAWAKLPDNWRQGMEYVHAQLLAALKDHGVKEINPLRQTFDPHKAHSLGLVETPDEKMDNIVLEVLKKGYELHGRVIRPAQVKVGLLVKK